MRPFPPQHNLETLIGRYNSKEASYDESSLMVDIFEMKSDQFDSIGDTVWEAALLLCTLAFKKFDSNKQYNILELGCGVGLSGMFVSSLLLTLGDNSSVTFSDGFSSVLIPLELTIIENFPCIDSEANYPPYNLSIGLEKIDWLHFSPPNSDSVLNREEENKYLIGSALCYLPEHETLADVIHYFISKLGFREAIICQIRDRAGVKEFLNRLTLLNLKFIVSDISEEIFDMTQSAIHCRTVDESPGIPIFDDGECKVRIRKRYFFDLSVLRGETATPSLPAGSSAYRNNLLTTARLEFICILISAK